MNPSTEKHNKKEPSDIFRNVPTPLYSMYHHPTTRGTTEGCKINPAEPKETTTSPKAEDPPQEACTPVDPSILTSNPPTELIQAPPVGVVQGGPRSLTTEDDADVPWKCTTASRTSGSTLFVTQSDSGATKSLPSFSIDNKLDFIASPPAQKNRAKKKSLQDQCKAPTLIATRVSNGLKDVTVAAQRTASPNTGSPSPVLPVLLQSSSAGADLADGTKLSSTCTAASLAHGSACVDAQRGSVSPGKSRGRRRRRGGGQGHATGRSGGGFAVVKLIAMLYPSLIIFFVVTFSRHVSAVCTPQNKADLILARDGCLGETGDGSCPKFAARSNSNGCGTDSGENGIIGSWNISRVTDLSNMFYSLPEFNADLTNWQTGAVTTMYQSTCCFVPLKHYLLRMFLIYFFGVISIVLLHFSLFLIFVHSALPLKTLKHL